MGGLNNVTPETLKRALGADGYIIVDTNGSSNVIGDWVCAESRVKDHSRGFKPSPGIEVVP